jgi:hypothetical protein
MKVFVSANCESMGKFVSMVRAFPNLWSGSVLDVGCRSRQMRDALPRETVNYLGVDLQPPADVVASLEKGLPFDAASSDTVLALDVLEHTDDIYNSFAELCRVARNHVLLALPNLYEISVRKRFLLGQRISGKYGLPTDPPNDRHRWIFTFEEALMFTHIMANKSGFKVIEEGCLMGPGRGLIGIRYVVSSFPNLLSPWYVALLEREKLN